MIPAVFFPMEAIPLTANGKVDVSRLPVPETSSSIEAAPSGPVSRAVLDIFRRVLRRPDMTVSDDYFLCGGDSLNALETLSELEEQFHVRLRVADLYACRTAARLESRLGVPSASAESIIPKAPKQEAYPLTPAQLGIYFESQMAPSGTAYNMPCGLRVAGSLDVGRLQAAVNAAVQAEPVLRASFHPRDGAIVQSVAEQAEYFVEQYDKSTPPRR